MGEEPAGIRLLDSCSFRRFGETAVVGGELAQVSRLPMAQI
jgi:hypothetical protein